MAKITASELHPAETVIHALANVDFKLTAKGTYETDDPIVLSNAESHPWLTVEYDAAEPQEVDADTDVKPVGTAIDAGENQNESLFADRIPVTLAADKEAPDYVDDEGDAAEAPANDPVEVAEATPDYEEKFD